MKTNQNVSQWKLLEMVHVGEDPTDIENSAPLQWLKFSGTQPETQGPIVILSGFEGSARNDSRILQLLQKALSSGIINTISDLYLCPIVNPNANPKASHLNLKGNDIMYDFPTLKNKAASDVAQSAEVTHLIRWIEKIQPKAILSLQADKNYINSSGVSEEVIEKLTTLSERPLLAIGERPALTEEEKKKNATEEVPTHNLDKSLGQWCAEKEILWINFAVDAGKRDFEELREDWRLNIGPALKWLLEGPRFNPPVEEPFFIAPTVIPSVELPPELMNL
jgi:hypothetical protein